LVVLGFAGLGVLGAGTVRDIALLVPSLSVPGWIPGPSEPPSAASAKVALRADEQRYLDALWPIHGRLEQSVIGMGLAYAAYGSGDLSLAELRSWLDDSLATQRRLEEQLRALPPPPGMHTPHDGYLATVRLFEQSSVEMLQLYSDNSDVHFTTALSLSIDGAAQLHELGQRLWPATASPRRRDGA
jgi:hypothetical protein